MGLMRPQLCRGSGRACGPWARSGGGSRGSSAGVADHHHPRVSGLVLWGSPPLWDHLAPSLVCPLPCWDELMAAEACWAERAECLAETILEQNQVSHAEGKGWDWH